MDTFEETHANLIDLVLCSRCLSAKVPDDLSPLYDYPCPIDLWIDGRPLSLLGCHRYGNP